MTKKYIFILFFVFTEQTFSTKGCYHKGVYYKPGTELNGYICHPNGAWYKKQ